MKYASLYERLLANCTQPDGPCGCWVWTGRTDGKRGGEYGRMNVRVDGVHTTLQPHRVLEEQVRGGNEFDLDDDPLGPILVVGRPALGTDETLDHLCGNTRCVNPDHWGEPVTRAENSRLRWARRARA